jgi:hypothetical protein
MIWSILDIQVVSNLIAANVCGFVQPGFSTGCVPPKIVIFFLSTIYGGTGIKASQRFTNDPRVA